MQSLLSMQICSALLLCGCAQHKQHQKPGITTLGTTQHPGTTGKVSVIEFDSNGTYWDKQQLRESLKRIRATPKPLLITFVHGWRHNARPDDPDLQQFAEFIAHLDKNKAKLAGGFTPIGLYIGWRGASINEHPTCLSWLTTLPALFSFWNIKHGTDRVALRGDLGHALTQTTAAAWNPGGGKSVMIGHSFGGRILEMVSSNQAGVQTGDLAQFKPLADLVVLINPASESLNARQTKLSLEGWDKPYPLIIAVGSQNDRPNGTFWSWGYNLGRQPRTRDYHIPVPSGQLIEKQKTFLNTTVTNDQRQITHLLVPITGNTAPADGAAHSFFAKKRAVAEPATKSAAAASSINLAKPAQNDERTLWLHTSNDPNPEHRYPFRFTHRDANTVRDVKYVYDSKAYWVLQVPESILSGHGGDRKEGHGGVLNLSMTDLVEALLSSASLEKSRVLSTPQNATTSGDSPKAILTPQGRSNLPAP